MSFDKSCYNIMHVQLWQVLYSCGKCPWWFDAVFVLEIFRPTFERFRYHEVLSRERYYGWLAALVVTSRGRFRDDVISKGVQHFVSGFFGQLIHGLASALYGFKDSHRHHSWFQSASFMVEIIEM